MLCIGAIFTACTDDEVINQTGKTPLQVSVNASIAKQSRAIVHGEYLDAGSSIGVLLFNPEDGSDYDGQDYYNIQYNANGEGEDQTWASTGVTPAVSTNEADLIAYYPYSDADVTEIAVSSPALASSATMDAYDGSLEDIEGQGDKFTLPVDFELSTGGVANDIMFVSDASVTSGTTTVSATIGGKKYTAGINFDQAYRQGYIYTYTLTLNNSGFAVTKVAINPWEQGNDDSATLEPEKPEVQSFFLEDVEYYFEEGMTWRQWLESDYNTSEFIFVYDSRPPFFIGKKMAIIIHLLQRIQMVLLLCQNQKKNE